MSQNLISSCSLGLFSHTTDTLKAAEKALKVLGFDYLYMCDSHSAVYKIYSRLGDGSRTFAIYNITLQNLRWGGSKYFIIVEIKFYYISREEMFISNKIALWQKYKLFSNPTNIEANKKVFLIAALN